MDKAYTLMYELDNSGKIASTSPLFQYDSVEAINKSFELKKPDLSLVIEYKEVSKSNKNVDLYRTNTLKSNDLPLPTILNSDPIFAKFLAKWGIFEPTTFEGLDIYRNNLSGVDKITFYNDLLDCLKEYNPNNKNLVYYTEYTETDLDYFFRQIVPTNKSNKLIDDLNKHNRTQSRTSGLKNRIMNGVYRISSDIHNLEASQLLMEMDTTIGIIDRVEKTSPGKSKAVQYIYLSPITKYKIQQENSVGKDNVGIAANGVKADGAIQQHFNLNFLRHSQVPQELKLDVDLHFNSKLLGEVGNRSRNLMYSSRFVRFANTKLTKEQFEQLTAGKSFVNDGAYIALQQLIQNGRWNKDNNPTFYDDFDEETKLVNHKLDILNPFYQNLLDDWNAYKQQTKFNGNTLTEEQYKDFLWFRTQFEDNAADQLSVWISMATD